MPNWPNWLKKALRGFAIFTAVVLVGILIYRNFPSLPGFHSGGLASLSTAPMSNATSPHCSGEIESVSFGTVPVVINPGGRCIVKWRVDEGRVDQIDTSGRMINVGPEGGSFDAFWPESVKASSGSATMHYKLVAG